MTLSSPTAAAPASRPAQDAAVCDVCPHHAAAHDAIGRRFCQATLDGALPRGCACRSA